MSTQYSFERVLLSLSIKFEIKYVIVRSLETYVPLGKTYASQIQSENLRYCSDLWWLSCLVDVFMMNKLLLHSSFNAVIIMIVMIIIQCWKICKGLKISIILVVLAYKHHYFMYPVAIIMWNFDVSYLGKRKRFAKRYLWCFYSNTCWYWRFRRCWRGVAVFQVEQPAGKSPQWVKLPKEVPERMASKQCFLCNTASVVLQNNKRNSLIMKLREPKILQSANVANGNQIYTSFLCVCVQVKPSFMNYCFTFCIYTLLKCKGKW